MKFILGADPECFLQDAAGGLISAIDRIGGTKLHPKPMPIGDGFAMQEDNVALEYNIPPSASKEDFTKNVQRAMYYLSTKVAEQGLTFAQVSAASFPLTQLMNPKALEFGCDPDFNAWQKGLKNPKPKADDAALRTCGGHVHVGYKFHSKAAAIDFIKYMDLFLGVPSAVMDTDPSALVRKELYGKPGAFRFKPYGVEYRSLSNFWIFNAKLTDWVWTSTDKAMEAWQSCEIDVDSERGHILDAMAGNKELAYMLIDKYKMDVVNA